MTEASATEGEKLRARTLQEWFFAQLPELPASEDKSQYRITLVKGDASFRRYFRAAAAHSSFILVDAPPAKEDSRPFITVADLFGKAGVRIPQLFSYDLEQGFLCQTDFGDTLLWEKLNQRQIAGDDAGVRQLYVETFEELLKIQAIAPSAVLPPYSEKLLTREMELFTHWFCEGLLGLQLDDHDNNLLQESFKLLMQSALAQPQFCVHRDYHSRNLLYQADGTVAVIDFQDAVIGPFTYDLVSLLKDCYIAWPEQQVREMALDYLDRSGAAGIASLNPDEFLRAFDWMGAQRHLKAIGIFSRLLLRDGKSGYLQDIPRTLSYLCAVTARYPEFHDFNAWLQKNVVALADDRIKLVLQEKEQA